MYQSCLFGFILYLFRPLYLLQLLPGSKVTVPSFAFGYKPPRCPTIYQVFQRDPLYRALQLPYQNQTSPAVSFNKVFSAKHNLRRHLSPLSLSHLLQTQQPLPFACPMRKDNSASDHLVCFFGINSEIYSQVNSLIKFCKGSFLYKSYGILNRILFSSLNFFLASLIFLPISLSHT